MAVDRRLQALDVLLETRDDFVVRGGEKIDSEYEENKMKRLGNEEPKRVRYRKLMTD